MERKSYIYGLFDATGCRYIGKSVNPQKRYSGHLSHSALVVNTHKNNWIKSLSYKPFLVVLEDCYSDQYALERECWWISFGKRMGWNLTNGTEGGEGTAGWKHSKETKAKIGAKAQGHKRMLGFRFSVSSRAKMSAGQQRWRSSKTYCHSDETRAKMSVAQKNVASPKKLRACVELAKAMSAANRGRKMSPECIAKRRLRKQSDEAKLKISLARKAYWLKRKGLTNV